MKKTIVVLLLFTMCFGFSFSNSYAGTPSNWAVTQVNKGINQGWVHKDLSNNYQDEITRKEFCKLLVYVYIKETGIHDIDEFIKEVINKQIREYKYPFKDVNYNNSDAKYIIVAHILGFTGGTSPTTFSPDAKLTREQAAKIVFGVFKLLDKSQGIIYTDVYEDKYSSVDPKFVDDKKIASWSRDAVYQIRNLGIMKGTDGNKFNPNGLYTREQAIVTAVKMCEVYEEMLEDYTLKKDDYSVKKKGNVKTSGNENIEQIDITKKSADDLKYEKMKNEVLELTNKERQKHGLKPFTKCTEYEYYADIRAQEIGVVMGHERPDGSSCFSGISGYMMVAENVAGGQKTPSEVVRAWMNSEGHRENILDPDLEQLAVGISRSSHGLDWVQIFYTPLVVQKDDTDVDEP